MLLLVPKDAEIEPGYNAVLQVWNIKLQRFEGVHLPEEGRKFHDNQGYGRWQFTYNKLVAWSLESYDKVVVIDADSVVLDNIDFLFGLHAPVGYTGADCTPHNGADYHWVGVCRCKHLGHE